MSLGLGLVEGSVVGVVVEVYPPWVGVDEGYCAVGFIASNAVCNGFDGAA